MVSTLDAAEDILRAWHPTTNFRHGWWRSGFSLAARHWQRCSRETARTSPCSLVTAVARPWWPVQTRALAVALDSIGRNRVVSESANLAAAVAAIRPLGQWFLVHTGMTALLVWKFSTVDWLKWPTPIRVVVWSWPVASLFVLVIIFANGLVSFAFERWLGRRALPLAPAPAGVVAGKPPVHGASSDEPTAT